MTESWTISVSGRVYGPYSLAQMQSFHGEGRLADHSMVARAGEDQFHAAREDTALAPLFASQPAAPAAVPASSQPEPHKPSRGKTLSQQPVHFVIMAEMKSRSIAGLEEEIFSLGEAQRFMPQAWVLVSDAPINAVRNALTSKLGKQDSLFIVDSGHDRAAWFNFAPESDARVRSLWHRNAEPQAKSA